MSKGITVFVSTDKVGSKSEMFYSWESLGITEQEFDDLPREAQEKFAWSIVSENINWGFYKVKENEQNA